ncbi:MAG: phage minor head protein [bacterium]|nr:phage minor head protein [bacterium]
MAKIKIEGVFGVIDPNWLKFLKNPDNLWHKNFDEKTKEIVANLSRREINNEISTIEAGHLLRKACPQFSEDEAFDVIHTEVGNTYCQVELASYLKGGFEKKRWRTSRDDIVCEDCKKMDGEEVLVEKPFSGGAQAPPLHSGCRCFLQAVESLNFESRLLKALMSPDSNLQ